MDNAIKKSAKDEVLAGLGGSDVDPVHKLIAMLKVELLADYDMPNHEGLSEESRKRAWRMVADLGLIIVKRKAS
jgi:hypothetical protein